MAAIVIRVFHIAISQSRLQLVPRCVEISRTQDLKGSPPRPNSVNHEASPKAWTKDVWFYDYRINVHHTLNKKTMRFEDLSDFIKCYNPENRHKRKPTWDAEKNPEGRWRKFSYDELKARDKTSLDVFWLRDKSLIDLDNLPEPDQLARGNIENLEAGLNSFREVLTALNKVA